MSARFSPRRRAYHRTSFISADASRLDAVHVVLHIQHIQAILASTPCTPEDFYALAKASRLDAVRFLLDIQHTQTLLASTLCTLCSVSKVYKRFWPWHRAYRNTSYTSAHACRLDAVDVLLHIQHIQALLASTPCMPQHIVHICRRCSLDAVHFMLRMQHIQAVLALAPCTSQHIERSPLLGSHSVGACAHSSRFGRSHCTILLTDVAWWLRVLGIARNKR